MENKELKKSLPEELSENDLGKAAGGIVTTVPCDSLLHMRCCICGKLKPIDQLNRDKEAICFECLWGN